MTLSRSWSAHSWPDSKAWPTRRPNECVSGTIRWLRLIRRFVRTTDMQGPTIMRAKQRPATTPEQQVRDFVRTILMCGTVPREPDYLDPCAEALILELLPIGPDSVCEELERMR